MYTHTHMHTEPRLIHSLPTSEPNPPVGTIQPCLAHPDTHCCAHKNIHAHTFALCPALTHILNLRVCALVWDWTCSSCLAHSDTPV